MSTSDFEKKAALLRKLSLTSTTTAGSGHPTSSLSAADLMAVLFDNFFTYDIANPLNLTNDRLVFSKGHASPLFYSLYAMAGALSFDELNTLRKFGSRLEGHPTPAFPFTDAATGSLGQGLSVGAGMAFALQRELKSSNTKFEMPKVYVLLGDGEMAEGQVWEACNFASHYKLNNLIAIVDINRLAQSQETMFGHQMTNYEERFKAFGFEIRVIDGHNYDQINESLHDAQKNDSGKPFAILAKTIKGKGISFLEDKNGWHGKTLKQDELANALIELGEVDDSLRFNLKKPVVLSNNDTASKSESNPIEYTKGDQVATREVYGTTLATIAQSDQKIYLLDGDVKNSTHAEDFMKVYPNRFIECFIAEQNMVSVAVGLSRLQFSPFVSTFAAFFTRAADQIRMAALSRATIRFVGSHVGVSIGEDGPSQMGLEDIALFGTLPQSTILQPADAVSATKLLRAMTSQIGISYMRTLRPKTDVLYDNNEEFIVGGSKILRQTKTDVLTVAATGITVHEGLKAQAELAKENINIRIIDCYSIKPVDQQALIQCLKQTQQRIIITVEDHFEHGGFGDFVRGALSESDAQVIKMAVSYLSRSGTKDELLADAGINANSIIAKVKTILKNLENQQ